MRSIRVHQRVFKRGDLVLAIKRPMIITHKSKGKFIEKWEGPFVIDSVYSNSSYNLINQDVIDVLCPSMANFLRSIIHENMSSYHLRFSIWCLESFKSRYNATKAEKFWTSTPSLEIFKSSDIMPRSSWYVKLWYQASEHLMFWYQASKFVTCC